MKKHTCEFGPGDLVEAGAYLICVGTADDDVRGGKILTESIKKAMGEKNWDNIETHLAKVRFSLTPELFLSEDLQAVVLTALPLDDADVDTTVERFRAVESYLEKKLGNRWQLELNLGSTIAAAEDLQPGSKGARNSRPKIAPQKGHSSFIVQLLRLSLRSGIAHVVNADNEEFRVKIPSELEKELLLAYLDSADKSIFLEIYTETAASDSTIIAAKPAKVDQDGLDLGD